MSVRMMPTLWSWKKKTAKIGCNWNLQYDEAILRLEQDSKKSFFHFLKIKSLDHAQYSFSLFVDSF